MEVFASTYNFKNLVSTATCFKNIDHPTCIDLILTNKSRSFQNTTVIETGLSDFHKLTVTIMKAIFTILNSLENKSASPYSIPLKMLMVIPNLIILLPRCFSRLILKLERSNFQHNQEDFKSNWYFVKLRPFLPINVMKNIYYSLIYSHIHAIEVWGSAFKTELDKILILQKRAKRLMTFNDAYPITPGPLRPSDPIFTKLNFLKVEDIFKFQVSKFVFKCLYGNTPLQFHNWFTLNYEKYGHRTRSNQL